MFIDSVGIESADLEDEFLLSISMAFHVTMSWGKATDHHALARMIREIEVSNDSVAWMYLCQYSFWVGQSVVLLLTRLFSDKVKFLHLKINYLKASP